ncbi:MAG: D-Ala-D-Ala carboxypeptidase family metallohydrolase [Porticoccaceae bacterium]
MTRISTNFYRAEFACKCGCGFDTVDTELINVLQEIRYRFGKPITITSGCRCASHNAKVNGAKGSQHMLGRAADIKVADTSPKDVYDYLTAAYPDVYGFGLYPTFTHVDTRSGKPWRQP